MARFQVYLLIGVAKRLTTLSITFYMQSHDIDEIRRDEVVDKKMPCDDKGEKH